MHYLFRTKNYCQFIIGKARGNYFLDRIDMDALKSNPIYTYHGGIIPIVEEIFKRKLPELIDSSLNEFAPRPKQCRYKYSDMIISWIASSMCGATKINHVTPLRKDLLKLPGLKIPSHDNIGYQMKKLVAQVQTEERKMNYQVNTNYYDDNIPLNRLLINATKKMGGLKEGKEYVLDVDCTFIDTRCRDAMSMKEKDQYGFYPMICLIDQMPVFISMRNGTSIADFRIKECVEDCINLLQEAGIKIKSVRTDGAGYRVDYLKMLNQRDVPFVTSSPVNSSYKKMLRQLEETSWRSITLETANHFKECEIAEISYTMWKTELPYRVIAIKVPTKAKLISQLNEEDSQNLIANQKRLKVLDKNKKLKSKNRRYQEGNWNELVDYQYKMITTNDWVTPAEELILFYNNRGTAERQFSFMKNDFGWKYPPFAKMNENTVFMIISALANNIFRSIVIKLESKIPEIKSTIRIKTFKQIFIQVIAIFIDSQWNYVDTIIDYREIF